MKNLNTKSIGFSIKAESDAGSFSAYGNTFDKVNSINKKRENVKPVGTAKLEELRDLTE